MPIFGSARWLTGWLIDWFIAQQAIPRLTRDQLDLHKAREAKHYGCGTSFGQSASGTVYILATVLERVDNDLLWCVFVLFFMCSIY